MTERSGATAFATRLTPRTVAPVTAIADENGVAAVTAVGSDTETAGRTSVAAATARPVPASPPLPA
ncbi:hypothetical protein, partial [Mycobacterium kansasii]|uniref:hypothetical protein n=1 Tax=Mycobacterium kansasii TaxID=1768 RepID=UPI001CA5430F